MTSSGAGLQPLFCQELEQFVGTSDRVRVQPNNEVALHHPGVPLRPVCSKETTRMPFSTSNLK